MKRLHVQASQQINIPYHKIRLCAHQNMPASLPIAACSACRARASARYRCHAFGTTARTKSNAQCLAEELKVHFDEIPIAKAVEQHFKDIQHDPEVLDVTYENSQARERTQLLMDIANQHGGIVIGTGDLSELALGWATYNGDHMSMYAVNASIPKTLVRHLVRYEAMHGNDELRRVLLDILDTPVSPELLPPKDGEISQRTEDLVGPYELHDYYLYYMLRFWVYST